jgi:hypothetical protein
MSKNEKELAPYSCGNCRRGKRKCDRILPSCGECTGKHKNCIYVQPAKRGPKPKKKDPYPVYDINTTHKMTQTADTNSIQDELESCEHLIDLSTSAMPIMLRERRMAIVSYIRAIHLKHLHLTIPSEPPERSELAYVYAMLSYVLKGFGKMLVSKLFIEKSMALVGNDINKPVTMFYIAASIVCYAMVSMSNGDKERTSFYLNKVYDFLKRSAQVLPIADESQVTLQLLLYRMLQMRYVIVQMQLNGIDCVELQLKAQIRSQYLARQIKLLEGLQTEGMCETEPLFSDVIVRYCRNVIEDLINGTDKFPLQMEILGDIINSIRLNFLARCNTTDPRARGSYLNHEMLVNAVRLRSFARAGSQHISAMREAADIIANTCVLQSRTYQTPLSANPIIDAAAVHLFTYNTKTEDDPTVAQIIGRLSDELKALRLGSCKHRQITAKFHDMITKIENVVQTYELNFALRTTMPIIDTKALGYNFSNTLNNFKSAVVLRESDNNNDYHNDHQNNNNNPEYPTDFLVGDLILEPVEDVEQFMHDFFGEAVSSTPTVKIEEEI